jgi:predicted nucleic-acid-binding protein
MTRDDPAQVAAAENFVREGAWISHLVLIEAVWVLDSVYEIDRERLAAGIQVLLNHDKLSVQDPDVVSAALMTYRRQRRIDFSDCMILHVAAKAGHLPLGTFDRALAKLEGASRV